VNWLTGTIAYLLIWWTALFAILPIGVEPDADGDPRAGGWRGVPSRPRLGRKLLLTTIVSAVIWAAIYGIVESEWISFRSGWLAMPEK